MERERGRTCVMPSSRNDYPSANANLTVPALSPPSRLVSSGRHNKHNDGRWPLTCPLQWQGRTQKEVSHPHTRIHSQAGVAYLSVATKPHRVPPPPNHVHAARARVSICIFLSLVVLSLVVRYRSMGARQPYTYSFGPSIHIPCHAMPTTYAS